MGNQHTLFVCTTCASTWQDGKRVGESGGEKLLTSLKQLHENWSYQDKFSIQPVECMSACSRPCAVSFAAFGKYTYLFGDLPVDVETLSETAIAIWDCASLYYSKPDGLLPWAERPQPLKKGILARIPPLPQLTITRDVSELQNCRS
jgi:predicted metal-binding protein